MNTLNSIEDGIFFEGQDMTVNYYDIVDDDIYYIGRIDKTLVSAYDVCLPAVFTQIARKQTKICLISVNLAEFNLKPGKKKMICQ